MNRKKLKNYAVDAVVLLGIWLLLAVASLASTKIHYLMGQAVVFMGILITIGFALYYSRSANDK